MALVLPVLVRRPRRLGYADNYDDVALVEAVTCVENTSLQIFLNLLKRSECNSIDAA